MAKFRAILGSAIFFVVAPLTIAGLIPLWISGWHLRPPLLGLAEIRIVGAGLVVLGLVPLLESVRACLGRRLVLHDFPRETGVKRVVVSCL